MLIQGLADVERNQEFAKLEQCCGENDAQPHIRPGNLHIGEPLEHHRKEQRDHKEGHDETGCLQRGFGQESAEIFASS